MSTSTIALISRWGLSLRMKYKVRFFFNQTLIKFLFNLKFQRTAVYRTATFKAFSTLTDNLTPVYYVSAHFDSKSIATLLSRQFNLISGGRRLKSFKVRRGEFLKVLQYILF
jgi:hypothetical protein